MVATSRSSPAADVLGAVSWQSLDLLDRDAVEQLVREVDPTAVISLAAVNPGQGSGLEVNTVGAENVAFAARRVGARFVHVSSDVVHSGGSVEGDPGPPYADEASPTPINDYGRSKARGEQLVLAAHPMAMIVRTSLIYAIDTMDRGTAGFAERLERGERLSLWSDAIRQPVWADALCEALLELAFDHPQVHGVINVAGSEALSRAEFARRLLDYWGFETAGRIDETSAAEHGDQPLDLRLDLAAAQSLGLVTVGVSDVLAAHPRRPSTS